MEVKHYKAIMYEVQGDRGIIMFQGSHINVPLTEVEARIDEMLKPFRRDNHGKEI